MCDAGFSAAAVAFGRGMGPRRLFAPSGEALRLGHASSEPAGNRGASTTIGFADEASRRRRPSWQKYPKTKTTPPSYVVFPVARHRALPNEGY